MKKSRREAEKIHRRGAEYAEKRMAVMAAVVCLALAVTAGAAWEYVTRDATTGVYNASDPAFTNNAAEMTNALAAVTNGLQQLTNLVTDTTNKVQTGAITATVHNVTGGGNFAVGGTNLVKWYSGTLNGTNGTYWVNQGTNYWLLEW